MVINTKLELKAYVQALPWYKKLFFPWGLQAELAKPILDEKAIEVACVQISTSWLRFIYDWLFLDAFAFIDGVAVRANYIVQVVNGLNSPGERNNEPVDFHVLHGLEPLQIKQLFQSEAGEDLRNSIHLSGCVVGAQYYALFARLSFDQTAALFEGMAGKEGFHKKVAEDLFYGASDAQKEELIVALKGNWHHIIKSLDDMANVLRQLSAEQSRPICEEMKGHFVEFFTTFPEDNATRKHAMTGKPNPKRSFDLFAEELVMSADKKKSLYDNMSACWVYIVDSIDDFLAVCSYAPDNINDVYEATKDKLAQKGISPADRNDLASYLSSDQIAYLEKRTEQAVTRQEDAFSVPSSENDEINALQPML